MTRKEKWAAYDARYAEWKGKNLAPAFVQQCGPHTWKVQYLIRPTQPSKSWLYRLFNDPPHASNAEPFYNGWPGDHRGWLSFETKEAARDFYKFANRLIGFDEYRALPHPPYIHGDLINLDKNGDFATTPRK